MDHSLISLHKYIYRLHFYHRNQSLQCFPSFCSGFLLMGAFFPNLLVDVNSPISHKIWWSLSFINKTRTASLFQLLIILLSISARIRSNKTSQVHKNDLMSRPLIWRISWRRNSVGANAWSNKCVLVKMLINFGMICLLVEPGTCWQLSGALVDLFSQSLTARYHDVSCIYSRSGLKNGSALNIGFHGASRIPTHLSDPRERLGERLREQSMTGSSKGSLPHFVPWHHNLAGILASKGSLPLRRFGGLFFRFWKSQWLILVSISDWKHH